MKTRKTSLLLASTSAAALSVFAFGSMGSTIGYACSIEPPVPGNPGVVIGGGGGYLGSNDPNNIECKNTNTTDAFISTFGGDDTVTSLGGDLATVDLGDDNDTILLIDRFGTNSTADLIIGGDGDDKITTDRAIVGEIRGGNGEDTISILDRRDDIGLIDGGNDDDTITVNGVGIILVPPFIDLAVVDEIQGGDGDDVINIIAGVVGTIGGGDDEDTINLVGGFVGDVDAGANNDTITVNGLVAVNNITGSTGDDIINVFGGAANDVTGGADDDTINLDGVLAVVNNITGSSGEDIINISAGLANDVAGGGDNDTLTQTGGGVASLRGGTGDDTIDLEGGITLFVGGDSDDDLIRLNGAVLGGIAISGDSGNDTIQLLSGLAGVVQGGTDDDEIELTDDAAVLAIVGDVFLDGEDGGGGDDIIELNGGTVALDVWGQGGEDTIFLNGTFVTSDIEGGLENDLIVLTDGEVTNVWGDSSTPAGDGDDIILLTGFFGGPGTAEVLNNINGGAGDDIIGMTSGTVGNSVIAGGGNDLVVQAGADVGTSILAGAGDDIVALIDGTVGTDAFGNSVLGGSGDDLFIVGGSVQVDGNVNGESDDDGIFLFGGTIDGSVGGGTDNDVMIMFDGDIGGNFDGESGDDLVAIDDGNVDGAVLGGSDNDLVVLAGGDIGGNAEGGSGDDVGGVTDDFDFDDLGILGDANFAGDEDTGDGTLGNDTLVFFDWTGDVNADRLPEWDTVNIVNDAAVTFTGGVLETDGLLGSQIEVFVEEDSALLLNNNGLGGDDVIIDGNLTNEGLIDLSSNDGDPDNVLTVTGDYTAASDLVIDTFLDDGKSVPDNSDLLSIGGNAGGMTELTVNPVLGSPGGLTGTGPTDGILVVEAATSDDDAFSLTNADLFAGIFEYELVNPDGQPVGQDNWYLQSDFLDQIYVYESLPTAMQTIGSALIGQLVERVGVRSGVASALTDADGNPVLGGQPVDTALWARAVGASVDSEGDLDSTTGANFEQTVGFIQGGGEVVITQGTSGRLLIGALGHWGTSSLDVNGADNAARGSADFDFYGGGLTATWYGTSGLYVDGVVQYTAYDIDISTATRWSSQSTDGYGIAASGEVGYRIPISSTAALVPQAQVVWQTIDFDDFTDPDGVTVSLNDGDSLVGRLGVAFENSAAIGSSLVTGYVEANLLHEFLGDNEINTFTGVGGTIPISQDVGGTSVEVGFGGTIAVNSGVSLYGEIDYTIPFDNGVQGFQALAGVRVNLNPVPPPPPAPVIAPVAETAFIVFFDWDRANLTPEANLVLDDVVVTANEAGYASIRLDGYTDLSGSAAYNLGLSERRANSVADGLIARGIAPDEIVIRAFGEENPLVPTPDGVREPQNRRVEIFLS